MIRFLQILTIFSLLSIVWGCSYLKSSSKPTSNIQPIHWQAHQSNCKKAALADNSCPSIQFDSINFKKYSALNHLIDQQFLEMVNAPDDIAIRDYLSENLIKANHGDHLKMTASLLADNDLLTVLELTVQETHAIQQYSPKKISYINFDKRKQKNITLEQAIQRDKTKAFWSTAQIAYTQWLEFHQLLNNKTFQEDWPFVKTHNIVLLPKHLLLKYDANTLAPYAMGEPALIISYEQLKDILKPEYLPR